ncbi:hypothetical protein ABZX92_25175 [Lentzea sp. NPDC006480]|uniref:hypothetical protein n=1 Tax=Lentzea sp. NPDC006480 TaxID=3157176 RepID=UPI0033AB3E3F
MTDGQLCVCGLDTVLVTVLAVIIAVVYGELVARLAVRHASPDQPRHRASERAPDASEPQ